VRSSVILLQEQVQQDHVDAPRPEALEPSAQAVRPVEGKHTCTSLVEQLSNQLCVPEIVLDQEHRGRASPRILTRRTSQLALVKYRHLRLYLPSEQPAGATRALASFYDGPHRVGARRTPSCDLLHP
jgi:hypothetical protein